MRPSERRCGKETERVAVHQWICFHRLQAEFPPTSWKKAHNRHSRNNTDGFVLTRQHRAVNLNGNTKQKHRQPWGIHSRLSCGISHGSNAKGTLLQSEVTQRGGSLRETWITRRGIVQYRGQLCRASVFQTHWLWSDKRVIVTQTLQAG